MPANVCTLPILARNKNIHSDFYILLLFLEQELVYNSTSNAK